MANTIGSQARREQLRRAMEELGNAKVASLTGFSVNTLKSLVGGFAVHHSTAKTIESWLDKNRGKAGHNRVTCKEAGK